MFQGIKCVVHGADHIKNNMICQDAAEYKSSQRYGIAVVADGHGGAKYIRSDVGSQKAVECAAAAVSAYMEDYDRFAEEIRRNPDYILRHMGEQFMARWTQAVEDYNDENPLTPQEKEKLAKAGGDESNFYSFYGSTVLVAVMGEDFHFGFLIGDGGFAVVEQDGSVKIPIEDKNSRANYTSSICSRNAIDALTWFFAEGKPLAMCVSTDGLIKSFDSDRDFMDYHVLLATMLSNMEKCQASLEKNLNKRTASGSGDDISISVVFAQEDVAEKREMLVNLIEKNRAEKKAREKQAEIERMKRAEEQEKLRRREEERRRQQEMESIEQKRRQAQKMLAETHNRELEAKRRAMAVNNELMRASQDKEDWQKRLSDLDAQMALKEQERRASQKSRESVNILESGKKLIDRLGESLHTPKIAGNIFDDKEKFFEGKEKLFEGKEKLFENKERILENVERLFGNAERLFENGQTTVDDEETEKLPVNEGEKQDDDFCSMQPLEDDNTDLDEDFFTMPSFGEMDLHEDEE